MRNAVSPRWQPGPAAPRLPPGQVDIWWVSPPGGAADGVAAVRAAARRARADILARYLGVPAHLLDFAAGPDGKPFLRRPNPDRADLRLEFNLSHACDAILVAVGRGIAVGVDVEALRPIRDPLRIARRVMSEPEVAALQSLRDDARLRRFFDLWTRLEARHKAVGRGLFRAPVDPASVSVFSFRPGDARFAALAVAPPSPQLRLCFFRYTPP